MREDGIPGRSVFVSSIAAYEGDPILAHYNAAKVRRGWCGRSARRRPLPVARGSVCVDHVDAFAAEDIVEGGAELAVAVVDQEVHPLEQAGEAEVACLLGDPGPGRVGGAARQCSARRAG